MKNLKLTIDLLPKSAWGTNFSKTLPKKDWDMLRTVVYEQAGNKCACCGKDGKLEAHEIWDFNIPTKTQTLESIVALCPACHGVKHYRNSQRIGYGKHAKAHFLKVNRCNLNCFIQHYFHAELLFEKRNKVEKWLIKAPLLDKLGINYKQKEVL